MSPSPEHFFVDKFLYSNLLLKFICCKFEASTHSKLYCYLPGSTPSDFNLEPWEICIIIVIIIIIDTATTTTTTTTTTTFFPKFDFVLELVYSGIFDFLRKRVPNTLPSMPDYFNFRVEKAPSLIRLFCPILSVL